jgi:hypothetical protein
LDIVVARRISAHSVKRVTASSGESSTASEVACSARLSADVWAMPPGALKRRNISAPSVTAAGSSVVAAFSMSNMDGSGHT